MPELTRLQESSLMLRRIILSSLFLLPAPALAQDAVIGVFYRPVTQSGCEELNRAILSALSQPPFRLDITPKPATIVISVPDAVTVEKGRVSGTAYDFTVAFMRDGDPLGQSEESCNAGKLADCTDQLSSDVRSAAGQKAPGQ
jgi:hypothetical protein